MIMMEAPVAGGRAQTAPPVVAVYVFGTPERNNGRISSTARVKRAPPSLNLLLSDPKQCAQTTPLKVIRACPDDAANVVAENPNLTRVGAVAAATELLN